MLFLEHPHSTDLKLSTFHAFHILDTLFLKPHLLTFHPERIQTNCVTKGLVGKPHLLEGPTHTDTISFLLAAQPPFSALKDLNKISILKLL